MNTAIYGMEQNLNVMYITLELNPELCARRMYSMITKMSQKELYVNLDTLLKVLLRSLKLKLVEKHKLSICLQVQRYLKFQHSVKNL